MEFKVLINDAVFADINDIYADYFSKNKNRADKFYFEFHSKLDKLKQNPFFYTYYIDEFRRIPFIDFPYIIIYKIYKDSNIILVQSVVHSRSNPKMIMKKLYEQ